MSTYSHEVQLKVICTTYCCHWIDWLAIIGDGIFSDICTNFTDKTSEYKNDNSLFLFIFLLAMIIQKCLKTIRSRKSKEIQYNGQKTKVNVTRRKYNTMAKRQR